MKIATYVKTRFRRKFDHPMMLLETVYLDSRDIEESAHIYKVHPMQ